MQMSVVVVMMFCDCADSLSLIVTPGPGRDGAGMRNPEPGDSRDSCQHLDTSGAKLNTKPRLV